MSRYNKLEANHLKELISIIIPARNEEDNIDRLEKEINAMAKPLDYDFEFIVIDNASTDQTKEKIKNILSKRPTLAIFSF